LRVAGPLSSSRVAIWASYDLRSPPYHNPTAADGNRRGFTVLRP
jgi:hypothetical protein